ncbi:MAG TPA: YdbL family protein [Opitutaceae bacterium]
MKASLFIRLLVVTLSLGFVTIAQAAANDAGAVKQRMAARQAAVDALKERGVVGESNRGFLEVRGTATAQEQGTIADENADRRTAYTILAGQTGEDADSIGRRRAQQIAIASKRGVWIQDSSGQWLQKR